MLEHSKTTLANASTTERQIAEIIALRYLASELEENLMPAQQAANTAEEHRRAANETWKRAVFGVLLGLREAASQGHHMQA